METVKTEVRLILIAFMFYSRIPVGNIQDLQSSELNQATRYLPLVGLCLGILMSICYWFVIQILPLNISIILVMALGVLLTGAFHEDGFADTCDGLGGGWTKAQKLNIMKDSRLGTYGAVGLLFLILMKYNLLLQMPLEQWIPILILTQFLSRVSPILLIATLEYVRLDESSKVKQVASGLSGKDLLFVIIQMSVLFLVLNRFLPINWLAGSLAAVAVVTLTWRWFLLRQLQGYTGDTLGAAQQISEISIMTILLVIIQ